MRSMWLTTPQKGRGMSDETDQLDEDGQKCAPQTATQGQSVGRVQPS
jgi:hypothetical protein